MERKLLRNNTIFKKKIKKYIDNLELKLCHPSSSFYDVPEVFQTLIVLIQSNVIYQVYFNIPKQ